MTKVTPPFAAIADTAAVGGKARSLARLAASGLPIPPGFVITDQLFRALSLPLPALTAPLDARALQVLDDAAALLGAHPWPDDFLAALQARLQALANGDDGDDGARRPARFAVRSSFAGEDRPGALAPGIYQSRVGVTAAEVPAAVREVLRSALGAGAAAYALAHGGVPAAPPVAVLVHRHLSGTAQGSAARQGRSGSTPMMDVRRGELTAVARATIEAALENLAGQHGPVEIEWVATGDTVTFLQLRPYQAPPPRPRWTGLTELPSEERTRPWRWDAAHNPLPLSTAHAGLVAAVDGRCQIGIRQRVLGGYLFWRPDQAAASSSATPDLPALVITLGAQIDDYRERVARPGVTLAATLEGFFPIYQRLFGELQPAARAARRALTDLLRALLPEEQAAAALPLLLREVPSRASERTRLALAFAAASEQQRPRALAAYLAIFGDEAPRWDVAVPTHSERSTDLPPAMVAPAALAATQPALTAAPIWQDHARRLRAALPTERQDDFDRRLSAARLAVAAGEDDDWLYARLQWPVRAALLALGRRLADQGALATTDQVFQLPLDWLLAHERGERPAAQASALAHQGLAAETAALANPPPAPTVDGPRDHGEERLVRGSGTSGRVLGRVVHRHGPAGHHPPVDAVLVATSLLPTELPLLQVAALVTETGGPLDHVAAQARERDLPAVVGAAHALALLPEGQLVLVDADAGLVIKCD